MISTVSLTNYAKRASNRAHRIDVHRHADAYLENLERIAQSEKLNAAEYKPGMFVNFIKNFAYGLEGMFKSFHI